MIKRLKQKYLSMPAMVKVSVLYTFSSILQKGVSFFAVPLYTRLLPAEQYGIYSLYQSWDILLLIFATMRTWSFAYAKGQLENRERRGQLISALTGLNMTMTATLFLLYLALQRPLSVFAKLPPSAMALMFCDFLLRPSFEYWAGAQRFDYSVRRYVTVSVSIALCTPVVSVSLIECRWVPWLYRQGVALILGKVLTSGVAYFCIFIRQLRKGYPLYDRKIWLWTLRFSVPLLPHFLSNVILTHCDRIMIGGLCGREEAAMYGVAYSIAYVFSVFNDALMDSITPWMLQRFKAKKYEKIHCVALSALIIVCGLNFMVCLCAPEFLQIMAPASYAPAVRCVPPVAASNICIFLYNLYVNIEYYHEKNRYIAVTSSVSAAANVLLNALFIPRFGFATAAYTTLVCYLLYAFSHFIMTRRVLRMENISETVYDNAALWRTLILAVGGCLGSMLLYRRLLLRVCIIAACFLALFLARRRILELLSAFMRERSKSNPLKGKNEEL